MKNLIFLLLILSFIFSKNANAIVRLEDEGTSLGHVISLSCEGAGIECTREGSFVGDGIITVAGGGGSVGGSDTQVQFNDGGSSLGGDSGLIFNKTTDVLTAGGLTSTGALTIDTSTLVVDATQNFVGIGDATPDNRLEVDDGTVTVGAATTRSVILGSGSYSGGDSSSSVRQFHATPIHTGTSDLNTLSGFYAITDDQKSAGTTTHNLALVGRGRQSGAGSATLVAGAYVDTTISAGTVTDAAGINVEGGNWATSTGTITNANGIKISKPTDSGSGVLTNAYGINIAAFDSSPDADEDNIGLLIGGTASGSVNAAIYVASGNIYQRTGVFDYSYTTMSGSSGDNEAFQISATRNSANTGTTGQMRGVDISAAALDASGTIAGVVGVETNVSSGNTNTVTDLSGIEVLTRTTNAGSTATNVYGVRVNNISNTGTMTNTYGVHIGDMTTGTQTNTAFGLYSSDANALNFLSGNTGFGSGNTAPQEAVDIVGAMNLTPQASPPASAESGDIYVDSTASPDELCFYDGSAWQGISSGTDANCA